MSAPLASLLLLASFVLCAQADGMEEAKAFIEECRKKNNLDMDTVMKNVMNKKLPETEAGKCFLECLLEKVGVIKDGKLNAEKAKEINAMKFKDKADVREKADQLVDKCSKEVVSSGKKCEFGLEISKCALKYAKEMNIPDMDFA